MTTPARPATDATVLAPLPGARGGLVRDVALVARFEIGEALRTRLLIVMLLLFVGGGALGAWGFTEFVDGLETRAAQALDAPQTRRPGGTLRRLRESGSYRSFLFAFVRDQDKAEYFAAQPPIVVFYGWAALMFLPWLVLFTSADTIASEVATRAVRYPALRTGRLPYAVGKAMGQAILVAGVTGLSGLTFFLVAWANLSGFEVGATALGILSYWPRVLVHALPFLGWAMCASMATSSTNLARILSLGGAVALAIAGGLAGERSFLRGKSAITDTALDLLSYLTPFGHSDGLAYPKGSQLPTDIAVCLALAVLYFAAGFAVLRRRDL